MKKICILTGATGDLGLDMAERIAKSGQTLCLLGRNQKKLLEVLTQVQANFPERKHSAYSCDITKTSDRKQILSQIIEDHGTPDMLINNAAILGDPKALDQLSEAEIQGMIDTNLTGTILFTREVLCELLKAGIPGKIVTIASTAGLYPYPYRSIYAATKRGLTNFTESIGPEYKESNISINCLCPGPTQGPSIDRVIKDRAEVNKLPLDQMQEKFSRIVSNTGALLSKEHLLWAIDKMTDGNLEDIAGELFTGHTLGIDTIGLYDKSNPKVVAKNKKISAIKEEHIIKYDARRYLIKLPDALASETVKKNFIIDLCKKHGDKLTKYGIAAMVVLTMGFLGGKSMKIDQKAEQALADFKQRKYATKDLNYEMKRIAREEYGIDSPETLLQKANETQDWTIDKLYFEIGQKALKNMKEAKEKGFTITGIDLDKPIDI